MTSKYNIICISDAHEKLQMAAMLAATAAVSGYEVTVFLTMNALQYFVDGSDISAPAEGRAGRLMSSKNVPPFRDLFSQAAELGDAKIFPCSMAMELLEITDDQLLPFVGEPMGLTKFLSDFDDGYAMTF